MSIHFLSSNKLCIDHHQNCQRKDGCDTRLCFNVNTTYLLRFYSHVLQRSMILFIYSFCFKVVSNVVKICYQHIMDLWCEIIKYTWCLIHY